MASLICINNDGYPHGAGISAVGCVASAPTFYSIPDTSLSKPSFYLKPMKSPSRRSEFGQVITLGDFSHKLHVL